MDSILKQNIIIVIAIALLSTFSDCGYCPVSAPTVSVVSKCPTTKTEWEEAANRKKCTFMSASTNCGDKMPVYHCLLNQWKNETVEVCASTWYISGFCAIYNSDEMKVIDDFNRDCTNLTDGSCPTRYISTDAYMYQRCYEKQDTRTSMPSTDKHPRVPTVCTLPVAILSILLIILLVLLLLTCLGKIPKACNIGKIMMDTQCMRSCKNTADEESGNKEKGPEKPDSEGQDDCLYGEETINETNTLLPNDQKPSNERNGDNNTSLSFQETREKFEVVQKEYRTIENEVDFSSRENHINEEVEKDEDPAADKENATQKDDIQRADTTIKNDVGCSSHESLIKVEDNGEEKEKLPGQTTYKKEIIEPNTKAQNTAADEDEEIGLEKDFSNDEDNDEEKTQSKESTSSESLANTKNAKSTEFEQKAEDTDEGGDQVFSGGGFKDKKDFFERKTGNQNFKLQ